MNEQLARDRLFTDRMFKSLFVPSLISAVGLSLGDVADALFVGIRLGKTGLAVMSLVVPVYMIFNVLVAGLSVGTSIEYTHCLAKGKAKEGVGVFSQMSVVTVVLSLLLMGAGLLLMPQILSILGAGEVQSELRQYTREYLRLMFLGTPITFFYFFFYYTIRCDGGEKLASAGYLIGYGIDVLSSALFILGFGWEVKGAILATLLGKAVGVVIFSTWILRKDTVLHIKPEKLNLKLAFRVYKTGFSSSVGFVFQFIAALVVNNLLIRMGGEAAVAEYNIVQNISYLSMTVFSALGDTVQPLTGTFYTEHNQNGIKRVMTLAKTIGITVGGVSALAFALLAPGVCRMFGLSEELLPMGAHAVRLYCLAVIPAGINTLYASCYQATGREGDVFRINFLRTFAVNLGVALVLSLCGLKAFWLWFTFNELLSMAVWIPIAVKKSKEIQKKSGAEVLSCLLDSGNKNLQAVIESCEAFCDEHGASMKQSYYVTMCLEEVCQAIIENAFKGKRDEYIEVSLICENAGEFSLHIIDNARNFNPFAMKTGKNYLEDEEDLASLGIQMVKTKAKNFFYRRYNGFNSMVVEI